MIVDWPVVSRDAIVAALRGGSPRTPAAVLRTARKRGFIGEGYSTWVAEHGALHGRTALWSSLSVDAARCAWRGLSRHADLLAAAARRLEAGPDMQIVGEAMSRWTPDLTIGLRGYPLMSPSISRFGDMANSSIAAMERLAIEEHKWRTKVAEPGVTRIGARVVVSTPGVLSLESEDGQQLMLASPLESSNLSMPPGTPVVITAYATEFSNWSVGISPGWAISTERPTVFDPFEPQLSRDDQHTLSDEVLSLIPAPL
jgi:hypothetical protein